MKRTLILGIFTFLTLFSARPASAVTLYVDPAAQSIVDGESTSADVSINGFGNFTANSLGKFEIDVLFDDSILDFDSISFTDFLGDIGTGNANPMVDASVSGIISVSNVTFLNDIGVDAIQPDAFDLFTLNFTGNGLGTSQLILDEVSLIYAFEEPIPTFDVTNGSITVNAAVPEPATMLLFGSGMVGAFVRRRK